MLFLLMPICCALIASKAVSTWCSRTRSKPRWAAALLGSIASIWLYKGFGAGFFRCAKVLTLQRVEGSVL
jgi:hypothetical protein